MNKKKYLALILIITTIIVGVGAIYIGIRLGQEPDVTPDESKAAPANLIWTNHPCSGSCESGSECNQYGDPPAGKMCHAG